ncbi:hypothetical protein B4168_2671 [Anoxybacillus flavithermus]|nr:hypothetical protein [Parageobacillus thermoglucosidasius]KYD15995.1 hypothetical protein B4168_2671 [Anoxybacillus flavithermus]
MLGDTAYDTKRFSKQPNKQKSYSFLPSTAAIAGNKKTPTAVFFLFFCKRRLANGCLDFAAEWNGCSTSEKATERNNQDGMDFIEYVLHVLCCIFMHNFEFLLRFCNTVHNNKGLPDEKMRHPLKNQASHQAVFAHRQRENGNNKINFCCSRNGQKNTTNAA